MKKFSEKYINDWNILQNAIIGFEFEFYADKSYYKLLEHLNNVLKPVKVSGFKRYHSSFTPTDKHWKIEPDLSLGYEGCEIITGPLPYVNSKIYLLKILKTIETYGKTDEKCSIHINISFDKDKTDKTIEHLNPLKLILEIDEDFIYKCFPDRKNNFYAKSIKKLIPFKNYHFADRATELLQNSLELPNTKYYGVNIQNVQEGRLEFRYIGGQDYEKKTDEILQLMDYFILLSWKCTKAELEEEDRNALKNYLSKNINQFKNYSKYENFIAEFPSITLQVDKDSDFNMVKTHYDKIYNELYDIITNIYNLNDCIINYDTEEHKIELVEASVKSIFDIKNINIINCVIDGGSFNNVHFVNCDIKNAHIHNSTLTQTNAFNTKIETSRIDYMSEVKNCYLFNSFLDGHMDGGIFRSGKIGEYGNMEKNVKIITDINNYFGVQRNDINFKDKMRMVGYVGKKHQDKKKFFNNNQFPHNNKERHTDMF